MIAHTGAWKSSAGKQPNYTRRETVHEVTSPNIHSCATLTNMNKRAIKTTANERVVSGKVILVFCCKGLNTKAWYNSKSGSCVFINIITVG